MLNHKAKTHLCDVLAKQTTTVTVWECSDQESIVDRMKRRKWIWIGHTLRTNTTTITSMGHGEDGAEVVPRIRDASRARVSY